MGKRRYVKNPALAKSEVIAEIPAACCDEATALAFWERRRWGDKPCCPRCGDTDVYRMKGTASEKRGLWRCRGCQRQYSIRTGSVLEESLLPLHKWAYILWAMSASKNGVSALEISRKCQITHKSALFALNRLRWAMAHGTNPPKLRGTVEVDEAFVGPKNKWKHGGDGLTKHERRHRAPGAGKPIIFSMIQRDGVARSQIIPVVTAETVMPILWENIDQSARVCTDELGAYKFVADFAEGGHGQVAHSRREYARPDGTTTNSVEGYFSRIRRSLHGTYMAVSREHFPRYLAMWDFLQTTRRLNDGQRVEELVRRMDGKRLLQREARRAG